MSLDETRNLRPIVIDQGSGVTKCGFSGTNPRAVFPTIIGKPKIPELMIQENYKDTYVGEEAMQKRGSLALSLPLEFGIVNNWDNVEKIWHHVYYNVIRAAPEEQPTLITEAALNPKANKEKIIQIMFETFNVPALYVARPAPLCLYAEGKTTGVVVDVGDGLSQVTPIFLGYEITQAVTRFNIGGRDLTDYLSRLLTERGYYFQTSSDREVVREIKERLCFVAADYDEEMYTNKKEKDYTLPDGSVITVDNERFRCSEALFDPLRVGLEIPGIHLMTFNSVNKCDIDTRKEFFENVVLAGGSTLLPGMAERMTKELLAHAPASIPVNVRASVNRQLSAWIGGSILADMSIFQQMWTSKEEYDESGPTIPRRCRWGF